ncbi:hypothetical protein B0H67DRAFT_600892 [Lasiosphaeris hirsuta]|uniref:DHHA2 domain-containing protein n=1 Tax=Lasiosphaeris hirsuta TaxID=260670 RepID=A0AA40DXE0_9PEZI|nr:hypothetical protein B0H67DRAFT_600892 [Lasiosphaeris hirsuta]
MASPARISLKTFLSTARKSLAAPSAQRPSPLTFVIGNESADLDSICSAVLLAYFRTHTPPHTLHIPLSNLPRADLALRPELTAILRPAGLSPDDFLTLSDFPKDGPRPDQTQWLLVDHNAPTGFLANYLTTASPSESSPIIGCIDHHDDEGVVPASSDPRVFAKCGSCMSLVLDHVKPAWVALPPSREIDSQLSYLALGPILIDTTNLASKDKTTEWDVRAVALAEANLQGGGYDRTGYFDAISELKEDISGLSFRDVLRKDYKRWADGGLVLGMSSVVQGIEYLTTELGDRDGFLEALKSWSKEQGLDIAAVMTVSRPRGVFTRELLVWAFGEQGIRVAKQFVDKNKEALGLEAWGKGGLDGEDGEQGGWRVCWTQRRVESSRKQVAPMLREAMQDASKL